MSKSSSYVIALDVGGSSIKSGIVMATGRVSGGLNVTPINSNADADSILNTFQRIIQQHQQTQGTAPLQGVAFGFPGPFDYPLGISRIKDLGKYEALFDLDLRQLLSDRLAVSPDRIVFRNDAEAAIVGEALYGAGQDYAKLIGVTLGTGFGSAFLAHGQSVTSGPGIPENGWLYPVPVGNKTADDIFSTRGLLARLMPGSTSTANVPALSVAARAGDQDLQRRFADFGRELGQFLTPYARDFDAEAVLLLGGLTHTFDLFGPDLNQELPVPAIIGTLAERAPLLGAAALLL